MGRGGGSSSGRGRDRPPARERDDEAGDVDGARDDRGVSGDWQVRPVTGAAATRDYRCPGCDQVIRPGTPHVVAWPVWDRDAEGRRHWHTACWQARGRRQVNVQRSRNAPRYG